MTDNIHTILEQFGVEKEYDESKHPRDEKGRYSTVKGALSAMKDEGAELIAYRPQGTAKVLYKLDHVNKGQFGLDSTKLHPNVGQALLSHADVTQRVTTHSGSANTGQYRKYVHRSNTAPAGYLNTDNPKYGPAHEMYMAERGEK